VALGLANVEALVHTVVSSCADSVFSGTVSGTSRTDSHSSSIERDCIGSASEITGAQQVQKQWYRMCHWQCQQHWCCDKSTERVNIENVSLCQSVLK
jgi:hypothetical protein